MTTNNSDNYSPVQYTVQTGGLNGLLNSLSVGNAGQVLQSSGAGVQPTFTTATFPTTATSTGTILRADGTNWSATTSTYPNTNAINTLLYASSANVMSALATANSGVLITSSGGVPSISSTLPSGVQSNITSLGTVTSGVWNGTAITVANGGTGVQTITGLLSGNGTSNLVGRTITGTSNQISVANGSGATANPTLSFPATTTFATTQPSMLAYLSAPATSVTGDGTLYTLIFDTVTYDQGSNYNNVTGVFTAPVTGNYAISGNVSYGALGTSTIFTVYVETTSYELVCTSNNAVDVALTSKLWLHFHVVVRMSSGNTFHIASAGVGGTKNNNIYGAAGYFTWLSCVLLN